MPCTRMQCMRRPLLPHSDLDTARGVIGCNTHAAYRTDTGAAHRAGGARA